MRAIAKLVAAGLGALSAAQPARAQTDDVAAFYKGRTLSLVIGHEAGTGYDLYGRLLTRHIGRFYAAPKAVVDRAKAASRAP